MPRIQLGDLSLNYVEHGDGDEVVLAIHGNLGCADWLALVLPQLPPTLRVIAAEWRGCGDSDKPTPLPDYSNYTMATHAQDHLALLDALGIERCHLYGHSTGGIIISHMLLQAPERFKKVLMLDPVSPKGLKMNEAQMGVMNALKTDPAVCFAGLATAAPTLFQADTLQPGQMPQYAQTTSPAQRALFQRIVDRTRDLSDGIWFGTTHNLGLEWESGALAARMGDMPHEHLILWGQQDYWIPKEHLDTMVAQLPRAQLHVHPDVGHAMNLEQPQRFAELFARYFASAPV